MGCEGRRYSRDAGATSDGGNDPCRTNGRVHVAMVALRQALAKYLVRYHFALKLRAVGKDGPEYIQREETAQR